jgi:hypothetical protein
VYELLVAVHVVEVVVVVVMGQLVGSVPLLLLMMEDKDDEVDVAVAVVIETRKCL